jgi:hypothetical protein
MKLASFPLRSLGTLRYIGMIYFTTENTEYAEEEY